MVVMVVMDTFEFDDEKNELIEYQEWGSKQTI